MPHDVADLPEQWTGEKQGDSVRSAGRREQRIWRRSCACEEPRKVSEVGEKDT